MNAAALGRMTRGWRAAALLAVLCLALYLPGLAAVPPIDRDESRFAQATRQMLESGDYLRIRFQDEARNKKPVGIYWLQAAAVAVLSDAEATAIWPYRLPSVAGAVLAVLLTFGLGARLVGREAAFLGAALLAVSLGLTFEAHSAKTDAFLLATVVAAQGALGEIHRSGRRGGERARWPWALLFWAAQGVAMLVKGPVVPILSAFTAISLSFVERDFRWLKGLRAGWGILVFAAIATPWLIAITVATEGAFLGEAVGHDFLGKLIGAQESHGAPPGYYLAMVWAMFWPGSLFLGLAAAFAWRERKAAATQFLLCWAVPFWLLLEAVPTKLPHYLLPVYPALALLAGAALMNATPQPRWLGAAVSALWAAVALAIAATLAIGPMQLGRGLAAGGVVAAAVILLFGTRLLLAAWRGAAAGLAARAVLLGVLVFAPGWAFVLPSLDRLWLSRSAAAMVERYRPPADVPVSAVGYSEPSLVFWLGTRTRLVGAEDAAQALTSARGAVALVESREDEAFKKALGARGWSARPIEQTAGIDYSNGRRMVLTLYAGAPS